MRSSTLFSALAAFVPSALALNNTFLVDLIQTLNNSGLTQLADYTQQINSSAAGQSVLSQLTSGSSYVLFAPNNTAFDIGPSNISANVDTLADYIAYHIVSGNFSGVSTTYPNVTLGRSLLSDPAIVQLEGSGEHQVVAWAVRGDGKVHVLNQMNDSTVTNTTKFGNVTINVVDYVLGIPSSFADTVAVNNGSLYDVREALSALSVPFYNASTNTTSNVTLFDVLNSGLHGFTLFAPNNDAVESAATSLASLTSNQTALAALFENHLINGTSVYSSQLTGQNYTSAAGEALTFSLNATGRYVTSGNVTALIVQPDVLLPNGVIHVVDRVLVNTASDPSAASSAASSASSAAATQTAPATLPLGFSATATSSSSGSSNAAMKMGSFLPARQALVGLVTVFVGILGGVFIAI